MGIVPVLMHLRTILRALQATAQDVLAYQPDTLVLVDYPSFNLRLARTIKRHAPSVRIVYYIPPKLWAWKEWRIKSLRRYTDQVLSILPFEPEYYRTKHGMKVTYVGNPSAPLYLPPSEGSDQRDSLRASSKKAIALLPGSRRQEIHDNLPIMLAAVRKVQHSPLPFLPRSGEPEGDGRGLGGEAGGAVIIAGAPSLPESVYAPYLSEGVSLVFGRTYDILRQARAALVTSGTATLEAAIIGTPQVVCYHLPCGRIYSLLRKWLLKVPYVSLPNLILREPLVTELIAHEATPEAAAAELAKIIPDGSARTHMLNGYQRLREALGYGDASERAAQEILSPCGSHDTPIPL